MDSDSDWDSLPGDPEPQSVHEPAPKTTQQPPVAPAPPKSKSPRSGGHHHHSNNLSVRNIHSKTPSKASTIISETGSVSPRAGQGSPRVKKMYNRRPTLGVTTFVDSGDKSEKSERKTDSTGTVNKDGKPSNKGLEMKDMNSNAVKDGRDRGKVNEGFLAGQEPPFTNFEDALPAIDVKDMSNQQESPKLKVKEAYIRARTPDKGPTYRSSPGTLPPILDSDESEISDGKLSKCGGNDGTLVNGQGQIVLDVGNDVGCCGPCPKKPAGYTYMFSHGNSQYLSVVPEWRDPYTKAVAERSERWLTYFWQEFFGMIALIVDFGLIFLFELMKFTFRRVLMRLLVGFIVVFGDHCLKPTLAAMFNSLLQPLFIFMRNVLLGVKNGLRPVLEMSREVIQQIAMLLRAFRLFELNWKPTLTNTQDCSTYSQFGHQPQIQEI